MLRHLGHFLSGRFFALCATVCLLAGVATPTYSIIVVDTATGEVCVAVVSCHPGGFDLKHSIPVVVAGKGAGVIQSYSDKDGTMRQAIRQALETGVDPQFVLDGFLQAGGVEIDYRQIGLVDMIHSPVAFTGPSVKGAALHLTGTSGSLRYSIQGNVLAGDLIVTRAEVALKTSTGDLGQRTLFALDTMRALGGDGRCSCDLMAPASCGVPPPNMVKSGHTGFMVLTRPGNTDGPCSKPTGCANGSYYLDLDYTGDIGDPDPVGVLKAYYDGWRAGLSGRPDHFNSTTELDVESLVADGRCSARITLRLADVDGIPLQYGGAQVRFEHTGAKSGVTTTMPALDNGDGTYTARVSAGFVAGTDTWRVIVDDGQGPVTLGEDVAVKVDRLTPLHAGFSAISGTETTSVPFTLNFGKTHGGKPYLIPGTSSGTTPGSIYKGQPLPLNKDGIYYYTWKNANTGFLPNTFGVLDATGRAEGAFIGTPQNLGYLIGSRLDWSAIVFEDNGNGLLVAAPVGFQVVP